MEFNEKELYDVKVSELLRIDVSEMLRFIYGELGVSYESLANSLGSSSATLHRIKKGEVKDPGVRFLCKIYCVYHMLQE